MTFEPDAVAPEKASLSGQLSDRQCSIKQEKDNALYPDLIQSAPPNSLVRWAQNRWYGEKNCETSDLKASDIKTSTKKSIAFIEKFRILTKRHQTIRSQNKSASERIFLQVILLSVLSPNLNTSLMSLKGHQSVCQFRVCILQKTCPLRSTQVRSFEDGKGRNLKATGLAYGTLFFDYRRGLPYNIKRLRPLLF